MIVKAPEKSELIAAIAAVTGSLGKIAKDNMNSFDKYKFASIDDFLAATGAACSTHGLAVVQNEVSHQTIDKKGKQWLLMQFAFVVMHESGESLDPLARTVAVPFTGAQAFGSAQSYALKQFMRSLFQITTGDSDDADFQPTSNETPDIVPKHEPLITDGTAETIMERVAIMSEVFPTNGFFESWLAKLKSGKKLSQITEDAGQRLIAMLAKDIADWPVPLIDAKEAVMAELATRTAEAKF